MSNQIEQARRLAKSVGDRTASDLAFGVFRLLADAVGVKISGSWVYVPGRATPLNGWRAAGEYIALLPETSPVLQDLANALDLADREIIGPRSPATVDELGQVAGAVADLAKQLARLTVPPAVDPDALVVPPDANMPELLSHDSVLVWRIIRRAQYEALRDLLEGVDAWVATARENAEAGSGSRADAEQFHADDIRTMVNDTARELGVPTPWRP